jgi:hypothetical protein
MSWRVLAGMVCSLEATLFGAAGVVLPAEECPAAGVRLVDGFVDRLAEGDADGLGEGDGD